MSTHDDGNLSLFGDELPAPPAPEAKKPRAKRAPSTSSSAAAAPALADQTPIEPDTQPPAPAPAPVPSEAEAAVQVGSAAFLPPEPLAPSAEPQIVEAPPTVHAEPATQAQPRRNSPWARGRKAVTEVAHKPQVMLVITKGEAGGAQSHVLALCEALHTQINFTVVIGGPTEASVLG